MRENSRIGQVIVKIIDEEGYTDTMIINKKTNMQIQTTKRVKKYILQIKRT